MKVIIILCWRGDTIGSANVKYNTTMWLTDMFYNVGLNGNKYL